MMMTIMVNNKRIQCTQYETILNSYNDRQVDRKVLDYIPALECDFVRNLSAAAAAVVAESFKTPVIVLSSGECFIMFTSTAAALCSRAADMSALSTPDDAEDSMDPRESRGFPASDDVMQLYDVSGDSMTSRPVVGDA